MYDLISAIIGSSTAFAITAIILIEAPGNDMGAVYGGATLALGSYYLVDAIYGRGH